jgi:hypothetical protein
MPWEIAMAAGQVVAGVVSTVRHTDAMTRTAERDQEIIAADLERRQREMRDPRVQDAPPLFGSTE